MPRRPVRRAGAARLDGRRRSATLSRRIGLGLRDARRALRLTQQEASDRAGIAQASWSRIERGAAPTASLETLASCAAAVGVQLATFVEARPGADLPRDLEHLRRQQLVVAVAAAGGWAARPEAPVDQDSRRSRSIDVHLSRRHDREQVVVEIEDLVTDGGAVFRNLADKVAAVRRTGGAEADVRGVLVLRATARNRATLASFPDLFRARFPASSSDWLRSLIDPAAPLPAGDGLLWSSSRGDRLSVVRPLARPALPTHSQ